VSPRALKRQRTSALESLEAQDGARALKASQDDRKCSTKAEKSKDNRIAKSESDGENGHALKDRAVACEQDRKRAPSEEISKDHSRASKDVNGASERDRDRGEHKRDDVKRESDRAERDRDEKKPRKSRLVCVHSCCYHSFLSFAHDQAKTWSYP
jgi:hypothetical protein